MGSPLEASEGREHGQVAMSVALAQLSGTSSSAGGKRRHQSCSSTGKQVEQCLFKQQNFENTQRPLVAANITQITRLE